MTEDDGTCYLVTDIETDGPTPGVGSMISIASVAVDGRGRELGRFVINLEPIEGMTPDPTTTAWWRTQPEAWAAATRDPVDPGRAIRSFRAWAEGLPGRRVFVANPLTFDGGHVAWYVERFGGLPLFDQPGRPGLTVCGLDLPTLVMGVRGWPIHECRSDRYPSAWLGDHRHTHRAIDDALGYAHLLRTLLADLASRPRDPSASRPIPDGPPATDERPVADTGRA